MQIYEHMYYHSKADKGTIDVTLSENENIILTIAFNNAEVIEEQIHTIKEHCKDEYCYLVADNSTDVTISKKIEEICTNQSDVVYFRLPKWNYKKLNPSNSHGVALNYVFKSIFKGHKNISNVLILDHDIFPIKDFSIREMSHKQDVYGLKMQSKAVWYIWPGFMYINIGKFDMQKLNFKPGYGGDTGSSNWKMIYETLSEKEMKFVSLRKMFINEEKYKEFTRQGSELDILDESWLHMVNASDWAGVGGMDLKLQSVRELLDKGI